MWLMDAHMGEYGWWTVEMNKARRRTVENVNKYCLLVLFLPSSGANYGEDSDESETDLSDVCCKCKRFQPVELLIIGTIVFVKWA